jgi:hypothetical protein
MGTKKKVNQPKQPNRPMRSKATTRSTAGVGFNFEDLVSAWLLVRMLSGKSIPGLNAAAFQLQMQTHAFGWDIDDQLISASADGPWLAISSKAALKVTASGLPADFVLPAWRQWRQGGSLRHGTDGLAMASMPRSRRAASTKGSLQAS